MKAIYNEQISKTEIYSYKVNRGGELDIRVSNGSDRHISIKFIDDKFDSVDHNLGDFNERSNWHIYKSIAEQITKIEEDKKRPTAV